MKYLKILAILCVMLTLLPVTMRGQSVRQVTIESIVLDINGKPIVDAAVYGNEGRTVKYTDQSGKFSITVPVTSSILVTSRGFISKMLQVGSGFKNIVLDDDMGDRKVNVAFKQVDSKDLAGAINVVNPSEYLGINYGRDVVSGLAGQVGGLTGSNNMWGMNGALVMIDGVPRSYNDIKMDEIDQVSYLKGVNAVVLYGSNASKGVILITTKRGEANNRKINVRVNKGLASPKALPSYLGSADYMTYYNQARVNDGFPVTYTDATIANYRTGNPYRYPSVDYFSPDNIKEFQYSTDVVTEFVGGNENARFYSNMGWSTNTSLLNVGKGSDEKNSRFNVRANVDIRINKNITSTIDASLVVGSNTTGLVNVAPSNGNSSSFWAQGTSILPWQYTPLIPMNLISRASANSAAQLLAKNSKYIIDGNSIFGGTQQYQTNPFADLLSGSYNTNMSRTFQVSNGINVDLNNTLKGLSFQSKIFIDFVSSYNQSINNTYSTYAPVWSAVGDSITGFTKYGTDARTGTQNVGSTAQASDMGAQLQFNYVKTVNDTHNFAAILLANYLGITQSGVYQTQVNSNMGLQLAYNYKHKYWFDFSGAYVNSTKLPANSRTAFSPTASIGWLVSDEDFMKGYSAIDHLKLSASAGIINEDLEVSNYFLYDPTYYYGGGNYNWYDGTYSQSGTLSRYGASPNLGFAQRKEISIDLEGSFFKRLLTVDASLFTNKIDNIPVQRFNLYPSYASDFVPLTNYNSDARKGIDVIINLKKKVGAFEYNVGVSAAYITSKALIRDELFGKDTYRNRVGQPTDAIFGLVSNGFFTDITDVANSNAQAFGAVKPGDLKYQDQNGDKIINQQDEVMIGRYNAPFNYGLNLAVSYKNLKLYVQGIGNSGGNGVKNGSYYWIDGDVKYSSEVLNSWTTATAATATYPRLSSITNINNNQTSSFWLYSTQALRLSKIQLTYDLPRNLIRKSFVRECEVYINGSNLYTFSKNRKIMDLTVGNAPQMSYFNIGLSAKF